jgi:hypothetical protein
VTRQGDLTGVVRARRLAGTRWTPPEPGVRVRLQPRHPDRGGVLYRCSAGC